MSSPSERVLSRLRPPLIDVEHVPAEQGQWAYQSAIAAVCEGVVSKRSRCAGGEPRDWLKTKPPRYHAR
jgi:ATP-dependent DNA ligase